jgi:membrane protease YdiL (CAAX protease family)
MSVATLSIERSPARVYFRAIAAGLLIALAGIGPWTVLARANATVRPDVPWAGLTTGVYLLVLLAWLGGLGPPSSSAERRRELLRLLPRRGTLERTEGSLSLAAIVALLAGLYLAWIGIGYLSPLPDLAAYPTTAYRVSLLIMGPVTAGVVEEAAYRGYMLRGLERRDPRNALWITSLVFTLSHITHGLGAVLMLGPGLFAASVLYGLLARRTGTILPGIVIHVLGDLAYTYFGVLKGNAALLFA